MIIFHNCALLVKAFGWKLEAFISKDGNQNSWFYFFCFCFFFKHENFCSYLVVVLPWKVGSGFTLCR